MKSSGTRGRPRADVMAESQALVEKILYCLEHYQPITGAELCDKVGSNPRALKCKLSRIMSEGLAHSELIANPSGKSSFIAQYWLGPDESKQDKNGPKQRTVSKWKPQAVKHEPIHAAFFGIQQ